MCRPVAPLRGTSVPGDVLERTFSADLGMFHGGRRWNTVAARTGARFVYSPTKIPIDRHVSLSVDRMTVREAPMPILLGNDAAAVRSASGAIRARAQERRF